MTNCIIMAVQSAVLYYQCWYYTAGQQMGIMVKVGLGIGVAILLVIGAVIICLIGRKSFTGSSTVKYVHYNSNTQTVHTVNADDQNYEYTEANDVTMYISERVENYTSVADTDNSYECVDREAKRTDTEYGASKDMIDNIVYESVDKEPKGQNLCGKKGKSFDDKKVKVKEGKGHVGGDCVYSVPEKKQKHSRKTEKATPEINVNTDMVDNIVYDTAETAIASEDMGMSGTKRKTRDNQPDIQENREIEAAADVVYSLPYKKLKDGSQTKLNKLEQRNDVSKEIEASNPDDTYSNVTKHNQIINSNKPQTPSTRDIYSLPNTSTNKNKGKSSEQDRIMIENDIYNT